MVVLPLTELICPWIFLQKIFNCLLYCYAWIKGSSYGLSGERVGLAISLYVLLQGRSLINLATVSHHWVLHEIKSYFAGQIVRNLEYNALIGCFDEVFKFLFSYFLIHLIIFLQVCFILIYCLNAAFLYFLEFKVPQKFLGSVNVCPNLILEFRVFVLTNTQCQSLS